jgi:hypothetical protein
MGFSLHLIPGGEMAKLRLQLDELAVESFQIAFSTTRDGTVFGKEDSDYTDGTCAGYNTCDASCDGSCNGTCFETCGGSTCDGTCGFSCPQSCYATCRAYRTECMAEF